MNAAPLAREPGATERWITAEDGTRLRVRVVQSSAPKGRVIVVHGVDDHLGRYDALSRFLHQSGYDVVLYDQRGHGESGGLRNHVARFSEYVGDLERVRDALQTGAPSPPHLFAHSMGTVIALLAAKRHPAHWRSVIVQGFPAVPGRNIPKLVEAVVRLARPLLSRLRVRTGLEPGELSRDPAVAAAYRRDPLVKGTVTLGWTAEFLGALRELRQGASAVACPLLILHGESDSIARPEGSRWLAENAGAKDRKLVIYPGLEHELHNEVAEDRARVFEEIGAWLDSH